MTLNEVCNRHCRSGKVLAGLDSVLGKQVCELERLAFLSGAVAVLSRISNSMKDIDREISELKAAIDEVTP